MHTKDCHCEKCGITFKKEDHLAWVHKNMLLQGIISTNDARELVSKLVEAKNLMAIPDDIYTTGYNDGFNGEKNSLTWHNDVYQMGWQDGSGDKLMEE